MTGERDFDLIARAWLAAGPDKAPDSVVTSVLEAAATTPQVRGPIGRPVWRSLQLPRRQVVNAVVAAVVVVVVGGIMLARSDDEEVAAPTEAPPATGAGVPGALRMVQPDGSFPDFAVWLGGPRSLPGYAPESGTGIRFTESTLGMAQFHDLERTLFLSTATGTDDGGLQVTVAGSCPGAVGDYRWSLSADGRRLTIAAVADPCAARLDALPGEWLKVACRDPFHPCLGDITAGTYPSWSFGPRLKSPPDLHIPEYGALTYTVPDGWANAADLPGQFALVQSSDYATYGPVGSIDGSAHEIVVASGPAMSEQTADCGRKEDTSVDRSVQGFIDWLRAQPRIASSEPRAITVGGYPGQWIDVRVAPNWTGTCPDVPGGTPTAIILTQVFDAVREVDGVFVDADASWGLVGEEQMRLVFVDIGQGDVVLIWVDATNPERFEALVTDAMPIIESMTIN
jgi:hypothetical protein